MEKEKFEGIDPKLKEEINKEGWEGDKEGGAAVFVGTKEEMEKSRERMENEGRTEDLGTYIRLHKEIILPFNEITDEDLKKTIEANKGHFNKSRLDPFIDIEEIPYEEGVERQNKHEDITIAMASRRAFKSVKKLGLEYIDNEGNIAIVKIDPHKIEELEKIADTHDRTLQELVAERLDKMGFLSKGGFEDRFRGAITFWDWNKLNDALVGYKYKLEKEAKEKEKKEFDF